MERWVGFISIHFLAVLIEQVWGFGYLTTITKIYIYLFQCLFIIYRADSMQSALNDL